MVINVFYDDDVNYVDIIFIPDYIGKDIEDLQEDFFDWLFDENNNHKYWIIVQGEKVACEYGTQAFVDWINNKLFKGKKEKVYIIKKNATEWDESNRKLIF